MQNFGMNIADLYAGLMMVFLFVSISMLVEAKQKQTEVDRQKSEIVKMTESQNNLRQKIYEDLNLEFKDNLDEWNAVIETDLTIRFQNPDLLFDNGSSDLKQRYKEILTNFFPRYMKIISNYMTEIHSISIDGHTSSEGWMGCVGDCSYFRNMHLSQQRSINTLKHCWSLATDADKLFMQGKFVATGLSYSHPVLKRGECPEGLDGFDCNIIDNEKSKRVEFKVKLVSLDFFAKNFK